MIYWRTSIFKTQISTELPVTVCMCVLFLGYPCGWRTAVKIPRGPGANPVRVCASAL